MGESTRYKVRTTMILCYGFNNKAWIKLRTGQIWNLAAKPQNPHFPWYSVERNGVIIDVTPEDFMKAFKEVKR